jgi:predicted dehydrogenase
MALRHADKVRGFCQFGRFHEIEVEDDVTAIMQYDNGTTATFVTSTGEAPGINKLEISAEQGRVTVTDGTRIHFQRNRQADEQVLHGGGGRLRHAGKLAHGHSGRANRRAARGDPAKLHQRHFEGEKLLSPAEEGIRSVELANAILLSTWQDQTIDLPMSSADYERILTEKGRERPPSRRPRSSPRPPRTTSRKASAEPTRDPPGK